MKLSPKTIIILCAIVLGACSGFYEDGYRIEKESPNDVFIPPYWKCQPDMKVSGHPAGSVAIGDYALDKDRLGDYEIAIGSWSGADISTTSYMIAIAGKEWKMTPDQQEAMREAVQYEGCTDVPWHHEASSTDIKTQQ